MCQKPNHIRLCAALIAVNLVVIWGNSLLPGAVSGAISDAVKSLIQSLFPDFGSGTSSGGGFLIRKLAHFTEFTCLGLLLSWFFAMKKRKMILPFLLGTAAACLDETIQMFVPDRGPGLADVALDASSVLFGIVVFSIGKQIAKTHFGGIKS